MVWCAMTNTQQELLASILAAAPDEASGLAIYRGNRQAVVVRAFSSLFPTVQQLLGDVFNSAVLLFIQQNPPEAADITLWAEGFASWLAHQEDLISYPYVAAIAAVEWHISTFERAADTSIDIASFQLLQQFPPDDLRMIVNPNCIVLASPLPLYAIWQCHQTNAAVHELHTLNYSICDPDYIEYLCISRMDWKAHVYKLNKDEFDLLSQCRRGAPLNDILVALMQTEQSFSDWLSRMLKIGAILGYSTK